MKIRRFISKSNIIWCLALAISVLAAYDYGGRKALLKEADRMSWLDFQYLEGPFNCIGAPFNLGKGLQFWDIYKDEEHPLYPLRKPLSFRALQIRINELGPDHTHLLTDLSNLAHQYESQMKYWEAEPLYERALQIREKALGPESRFVVFDLLRLAEFYDKQGRFGDAEPLYERALQIREKTLGPEHPDVATVLFSLAILHEKQGKLKESRSLYERALQIREKELGADNDEVSMILVFLAGLYENAEGELGNIQTEPLYKRSLIILENESEPGHCNASTSLDYRSFGSSKSWKYSTRWQQELLYKRLLQIREKALGPEHPDVAVSIDRLAQFYYDNHEFKKAEPLYIRSFDLSEKERGRGPLGSYLHIADLANCFYQQAKYEQVERLFKHELAKLEDITVGTDDDSIFTEELLSVIENLAALYDEQGRFDEAKPLYLRALEIKENQVREKKSDEENLVTLLENLALLYYKQGKYWESEPLYKRIMVITAKKPDLQIARIRCLKQYGKLLRKTKRLAEAEKMEDLAKKVF